MNTRVSVASLLALMVILLPGCQTADVTTDHPRPLQTPAFAAIRDSQNARIAKLGTLEAGGVLELEWTDADGDSHFEPQIDIRLLFKQPRKLSLRMYKFDTVMWLGSNDSRYWLFDMISEDDDIAYVGDWEHGAQKSVAGVLHPMTLLDLTGLFSMPTTGELDWSEEYGGWFAAFDGRGGPIRAYFDPATFRPIVVQTLDDSGRVYSQSALRDYMRVESVGMPPADFPRMPRRIELHDLDEQGTAEVTLDGPTTEIDLNRLKRATDLDRLMSALKPDEVRFLSDPPEAVSAGVSGPGDD